ncbi:Hypothetical protein FKW44_002114 [Caligus rogercresseyi]|uniref:Uncharacterized protein n=1 Tax=Caligus rogercresseyi TaxID=217165 RepID=A0A7T8QW39_CALRO|nr:Hypothetical protein FKW44_002114 [Caligus rogercresseyi]
MEEHDRKTAELAAKATERYDASSKPYHQYLLELQSAFRLRDEALGPRWSRHLGGSQPRLQNLSSIRTWRLEKQEIPPLDSYSVKNSEAAVKDSPRAD